MEIHRNETYAVLGPNGSGKTAFLKTIAGILLPLKGIVQPLAQEYPGRLQIGYVPQREAVSGLLPLTVHEVIQMGTYGNLKPWQPLGDAARERIHWAKQEVGIGSIENKFYAELSGGQQQRVLIARALVGNPAILVLDEPLASLDKQTMQTILELLDKLKAETKLSLLWADHFVPELLAVVHNVLLIEEKSLQQSTVDEFLRNNSWEKELP